MSPFGVRDCILENKAHVFSPWQLTQRTIHKKECYIPTRQCLVCFAIEDWPERLEPPE